MSFKFCATILNYLLGLLKSRSKCFCPFKADRMKFIKSESIEIPEENPFLNCKLKREIYADNLTQIIEAYSGGFVLSVDNKWGSGKTTFIKMWEAQLKLLGYKTAYYNSWENDFDVDPFVSIMSELKVLGAGEKQFEDLILKAGKFSTKLIPLLAKGVMTKALGESTVNGLFEVLTAESSNFLAKQIDDFSNRKNSIINFKTQLTEYVSELSNSKPLIFFLDELDRCRPDFAVLVLEKIKHLFNVPKIIFVLSIDKVQLSNSIKGYYGSESIDAKEYLRRFIDIEYSIPSPQIDLYCKYLYEYYSLNLFFETESRKTQYSVQLDGDNLLKFAITLSERLNLTIRIIEKLFLHTNLVVRQFSKDNYFFPITVFWLIYLRDQKNDQFIKLVNRDFGLTDFVNEFEQEFYSLINSGLENATSGGFTCLVTYYCNYLKERDADILLENPNHTLNIKLKYFSDKRFVEKLGYMSKDSTKGLSIKYLLDRINLLENFKN